MKGLHKILHVGRLLAAAFLLLVFARGTAFAAGEQAWTLQDSAGQVRLVKSGISPIALTVGDVFDGGDWIETGPDGRAVLRRGAERIVVAPNSRIGLPRVNNGPFATRILQTLGTILLTVEKKASQHFEVQTPYLTAVVKGTTFTVGIEGKRAVVHVVEGLVEVRDLASGQRGMVRPGQTGMVLSDSGAGVTVRGGARGANAPVGGGAQVPQAAPNATDELPAGQAAAADGDGQARSSGAVVIREALGPVKINLMAVSGGLVRDTGRTAGSLGIRGGAEPTSVVTAAFVDSGTRTTALTGATQTTTTALIGATQPTASTLTSLTQPTTSTLTTAIQPIASPVSSAVQPIASPVVEAVAPIVKPVLGLLK